MFRKIVTGIIVVPLAIIIVAFAVANRQMVTVSFDPFSSASPAYAATVPLFVLIFILLIVGVIIGGVAAWIGQAKWRRGHRRARRRGAQAPERGRHHRDAHDDDARRRRTRRPPSCRRSLDARFRFAAARRRR